MSQRSRTNLNLLEEAETWSDRQIEDRLQDLLDFIHPVLLDEQSEYELRLDCVRITADKIARFVPVYEAEESVFYPLLNGVVVFLNQVFESVCRTEDESRVMLISVATALIDHTDTLLLHGSRFDGLGPGEIPSIPRVIPKILLSTFKYCTKEQAETSSEEVKASITRLYVRTRTLLENFSALLEKMKMRTVLEDELDILVELCSDLLAFHGVLFPVDLKTSFSVWKLYGKLLKDHHDRLRLKLDIEETLLVLLKETIQTFHKFEEISQEQKEDSAKKMNRAVIALVFLVKIATNIADIYRNNVESNFDIVIELLGFMFLKGGNLFPHLEPNMVDKLNRELFLQSPARTLLDTIPNHHQFAEYLFTAEISPNHAFSRLQILALLLENPATPEDTKMKLIDSLILTFGFCETENQVQELLESVEVPGNQVSKIGCYEWVLTKVCRCISVVTPEQFADLEAIVFKHLVGDSNLCRQLCCDILCFIGRFGSAELCLSHLETVSELYSQLNHAYFSNLALWLESLIGRLFNFLGLEERSRWSQKFSPVDPNYFVLWGKISLSMINDEVTLKLLNNVALDKYDSLTAGAEHELDPVDLSNVLEVLNGLELVQHTPQHQNIMLTLWQKLADGEFVTKPRFSLVQFMCMLAKLSVTLIPRLSRRDVSSLISCLRTIASVAKVNGNPAFLVYIIISMLKETSDLDWITQIENVDPCLVTEVGTLSSNCMRSALRNPILRRPGLLYLRNLADRSNNPGFIRLCADESDVMPHFRQFLKDENILRNDHDVEVKFDYSAPSLEVLLNKVEDVGPELKRRMSSAKISPRSPLKKRLRPDDVSTPSAIITLLEQNLAELEKIVSEPQFVLSETDKDHLTGIMDRTGRLLDKS